MAKNGKIGLIIFVAVIGAAAGFGYFTQAAKLTPDAPEAVAAAQPVIIDKALLVAKPSDLIIGDANAPITMVEYSSLSCPHCAHFHEKILPDVEKEFITTGKVKLVVRYFPLNEAAEKASEIVECAGRNNLKREEFLRTFFKMQAQWAFDDKFLANLKKIALVGGLDSASIDSCLADKDLETRVLSARLEAAEKLHVNSTPTFFVDGVKYEGEPSVKGFRDAIANAGSSKK